MTWWEKAACREAVNDDVWYGRRSRKDLHAMWVCAQCSVTRECLIDAISFEQDMPPDHVWGIRAGLTATERTKLMGTFVVRKAPKEARVSDGSQ